MAERKGMRAYWVTLEANVPRKLNVAGDYFHVLEAADAVSLSFDNDKALPLARGIGGSVSYEEIEFTSATAQTVVVVLGFGTFADYRASVNASITTNIAPGNTINNGGDVAISATSSAELLAADSDRLYALVKNPSTNTVTVRIGDATVGATDGTPLEPGETLPIATTAAIYGYNPSGGAVTISAMSVQEI